MSRRSRAALRLLASLAALLLSAEAALFLASFARPPLTFDVGPSTGDYLQGFTDSWEYHPTTARFVGRIGALRVPLEGRGEQIRVSVRYARLLEAPVRVLLYASQTRLGSFVARPAASTLGDWVRSGRRGSPFDEFRVTHLPETSLPHGALELELLIEDRDPYALAIDWVRIEGARWSLPLATYHPRLLIVGVLLLGYASGLGLWRSLLAASVLAAAVATWAALDPFALSHVAARVTWPALMLTLLGGFVFRARPHGKWVALIFLTGYLVKAAGLFHPSFFYADVRTHRRYLLAFDDADARGGIAERGRLAQRESLVGYPVRIAERDYVFPYSPLFYLPFTLLDPDPEVLDEAMKHVALACGSAEVWVAYWLAGLVLGARFGVLAALLAAFLPPMFSRLFFAMWPAIAGHFTDSLAIGAALLLAARPRDTLRFAVFLAASALSLSTYVVGFVTLGTFVASLGIFERRFLLRVFPFVAALSILAVVILYRPFLGDFFHEILPSLAASSGEGGEPYSLAIALSRIPMFFGYVYPILALLGLVMIYRRASPPLYHGLAAYALTFAIFVLLRAFGGRVFSDLKEILFIGPLVAVTAGSALELMGGRGKRPRAVAITIVLFLVGFGIAKYLSYLAPWIALAELD